MKPELNTEQREVLERTFAHMLTFPRSVWMGTWLEHGEARTRVRVQRPPCQTVACFAGHVAMQLGWPPAESSVIFRPTLSRSTSELPICTVIDTLFDIRDLGFARYVGIGELVARYLGYKGEEDATHLFLESNWPEPWRTQYWALETETCHYRLSKADIPDSLFAQRAQTVVGRMRHWMETGE